MGGIVLRHGVYVVNGKKVVKVLKVLKVNKTAPRHHDGVRSESGSVHASALAAQLTPIAVPMAVTRAVTSFQRKLKSCFLFSGVIVVWFLRVNGYE